MRANRFLAMGCGCWCLLAAPVQARQPEAARFGEAGQWVMLGSSNALRVFKETFSESDAKYFDIDVAVGLDRFVVRHFSVGFDASVSYADNQGYIVNKLQETKATSFAAGVRFGYDVPFGARVSWYPRLTLALSRTHSETTVAGSWNDFPATTVSSSIGPEVNLYAPLLLHLAPHFVVGFGPRVQHSFGVQRGGPYDGTQSSLVSGDLVVGGWWGETNAVSAEDAPEPDGTPFGKRGQLVLGLATDASLTYRANSASQYSETTVLFAPNVDYFVIDNLSLGVDAFVAHSSGSVLDLNGAPTDQQSTSIGLAPRIGTNVPLTKWSYLWPQVELGYGTFTIDQRSGGGTNQHWGKRSWLRLSAPVLVNVTSHFLLGAGPYFFRELSRIDQYGVDNKGESFGARLVMAGWL